GINALENEQFVTGRERCFSSLPPGIARILRRDASAIGLEELPAPVKFEPILKLVLRPHPWNRCSDLWRIRAVRRNGSCHGVTPTKGHDRVHGEIGCGSLARTPST